MTRSKVRASSSLPSWRTLCPLASHDDLEKCGFISVHLARSLPSNIPDRATRTSCQLCSGNSAYLLITTQHGTSQADQLLRRRRLCR